MGLFDSLFRNVFGDSEVAGKSPDAESDFYRTTDFQVDRNYWHERFCDMLISLSQDSSKEFFILYGGVVTDSGSGQIDISEGVALGKDTSGGRRFIYQPALVNVDIPAAWKDDRQLWVIGKNDHKLGAATRNHYIGTSYHYQMEDTYYGDSDGLNSTDSDDLFLAADPGDTMVIWGSCKMSAGDAFTDLSNGNRTRIYNINENNSKQTIRGILVSNWTQRQPAVAKNVHSFGIAWSPALTLFCSVGAADGADAYILTSPDGITWTERAPTVVKNIQLNDVTWSPALTLFCAVGNADGADAYILTSPDGITWTERAPTVVKNISLYDICWSPDLALFCAVGAADGVDAYILTSPDGITWTERVPTVAKNLPLYGIAWSPALTLFCAVGNADGVHAYMLTSPDGITWTERDNPANISLNGVDWSPDLALFCAVGSTDGTNAYIVTSPDGITWTERDNDKSVSLSDICWSPDLALFCAVGASDGVDSYVLTSPDGTTWTERVSSGTVTLNDVCWSPALNLFCTNGNSAGVRSQLETSMLN